MGIRRYHSEQSKNKMSQAHLGMKQSEETKNKISEAGKGRIPWNKGIHLSEEHRKKTSESHKKITFPSRYKKGHIPWIKGRHQSDEAKTKISLLKLGNLYNLGKKRSKESKEKSRISHIGKKLTEEQIRKALRFRPINSLERNFLYIIERNNLPYKFVGNGDFFIEGKNPDFINSNGQKIAIEVYAKWFKEKLEGGIEKWKEERQEIFNRYGWRILFFDESFKEEDILKQLG